MKKPRLVGLYRDYTTQFYRDYNRPIQGSALTNQYRMKRQKRFDPCSYLYECIGERVIKNKEITVNLGFSMILVPGV